MKRLLGFNTTAKLSSEMMEYINDKLPISQDRHELITKLNSSDYNFTQKEIDFILNSNMPVEQVIQDFENGLTIQQINFYNDPNFNSGQMQEIREDFEDGLTMEQIKFYADPKFDWDQAEMIRYGLKNGLTMEQIKLYANPEFDWKQMDAIIEGFENGLTMQQVKLYADPKFDYLQMNEIRRALEDGVSLLKKLKKNINWQAEDIIE